MNKILSVAETKVVQAAKKFTNVTVTRGGTTWPKAPKEQERVGIRWDYDGEVVKDDVVYNNFQVQPNGGDVPTAVRLWREQNGGTHAVIGNMLVKKDGTPEDVKKGYEEFKESLKM